MFSIYFFSCVAAPLIALVAPFRFRRTLFRAGAVMLALGIAWLYLPGYFGGDAYYRLTALAFFPLAVGGGIFFGVLARIILDEVPFRGTSPMASRALRVLILLACVIGGGLVYAFGFQAISQVWNQQRIRFDRADLGLTFRKAINDKKVPHPANDDFRILGASCGMSPGMFYQIRYLDESDEQVDYFVTSTFATWELHVYEPQHSEIILPRVTRPY